MNAMPIVLRNEAQSELDAIVVWYEAHRERLGDEFLEDLQSTFSSIQARPKSCSRVTATTHRARLDRFPYAIYFETEAEQIVVTVIVHTARSPRVWKRRAR